MSTPPPSPSSLSSEVPFFWTPPPERESSGTLPRQSNPSSGDDRTSVPGHIFPIPSFFLPERLHNLLSSFYSKGNTKSPERRPPSDSSELAFGRGSRRPPSDSSELAFEEEKRCPPSDSSELAFKPEERSVSAFGTFQRRSSCGGVPNGFVPLSFPEGDEDKRNSTSS